MKKSFLLIAALLAFATPAQAGKGNGKDHNNKHHEASRTEDALDRAGERIVDTLFTATEIAIIKSFFGDAYSKYERTGSTKGTGLPPGLAKRDRLPPGLEKQLVRKGRLPPGLQKRALPDDLVRRLGPAPKGTKRLIVGTDVLLIDAASEIILDVIRGALNPPRSDIQWNN